MSTLFSPAQVAEFYNQGWTLARGLFDPGEVREISAAFDRLWRRAQEVKTTQMSNGAYFVLKTLPDQVGISRIVWCGAAEPVLSNFGKDPRLVDRAGQILESPEMQQLINQAHFKLPNDGVEFPWHQDIQHRDKFEGAWHDVNQRGSYVQTLMAVDAMTMDNGPLLFIPGSNQRGRVDLGGDGYNTPTQRDLVDESTAVPALMNAGDVVFFGPYTIHGSLPNQSAAPRRVFINGYAYPGANARIYPGEGAGRTLRVSARPA